MKFLLSKNGSMNELESCQYCSNSKRSNYELADDVQDYYINNYVSRDLSM